MNERRSSPSFASNVAEQRHKVALDLVEELQNTKPELKVANAEIRRLRDNIAAIHNEVIEEGNFGIAAMCLKALRGKP